jgi:hypothetical protein
MSLLLIILLILLLAGEGFGYATPFSTLDENISCSRNPQPAKS